MSGCATHPPGSDFQKSTSVAFGHPEQTAFGSAFAEPARAHAGQSGFRLLSVGVDGFAVRMQVIERAQQSLDLQYYIFTADSTGHLLTKALLDAADRGVKLRILVDDASTRPGDEQVQILSAHPNIEVRIFNPFFYRGHLRILRAVEFAFNSRRLDYRMHNKLFVADNAIALVGGRNLGDEYFQVSADAQYADDDVFVGGPLVLKLSATFDEFWASPFAIPVEALPGGKPTAKQLAKRRQLLAEHWQNETVAGADYQKHAQSGQPLNGLLSGDPPLSWAPARIVSDSPDKKEVLEGVRAGRLMYRPIARSLAAVVSEFAMITPYLVPTPEEMTLLHSLRLRGVRVRILTNSLNSNNELTAHSGYLRYRTRLLEDGVEIYEVRALLGPRSHASGQSNRLSRFGKYGLHAKLLVFDRQSVYAGSMNFDQRSRRLNTEIGVIVDSADLARQTLARFDAMTRPSSAYAVKLHRTAKGKEMLVWSTLENDKPVEYTREPSRSEWRRFQVTMLSWFPLDSEL